MFDNDVWDRRGTNTLSRSSYTFLLGAFTAAGIAFCAFFTTVSHDWVIKGWGLIGFALAVLVVAMAGAFIAMASDNPAVSTVGFALVAGPFGLLLGPVVAQYSDASVLRILALTVLLALVLGVVGAVIPQDLSSWGIWLFGGLSILLLGLFAVPIMGLIGLPIAGAMTVLDWAGLVLFGLYVIYDLNRAMRIPFTLDNAIDCALSLFLDMINMFIRLLALFGDSN